MARGNTSEHLESRLTGALDRRAEQGSTARFWWRDDDAIRDGPALTRLLETTGGAPLALAVIPAPVEPRLAEVIAGDARVCVFQHGWAHVNHAPRGRGLGAWELDGFRPGDQVLAEMDTGKSKLEDLFGDRFVPVLVPPWNRVHEPLLTGLAALGFTGVSAMGTHGVSVAVPGLLRVDCEFDVLRWKAGVRFAGWDRAAEALEASLVDPACDGLIGINTHHAVTDTEGWRFIECLARLVAEHPVAEWTHPARHFEPL